MIYQKDWLMRQIEEMLHALLAIATGRQEKSSITRQLEDTDGQRITRMLEDGELCGAENLIYEHLDGTEEKWLHIAVAFYTRLNEYSDEYLAKHNFSREEIADGLKNLCEQYGLQFLL